MKVVVGAARWAGSRENADLFVHWQTFGTELARPDAGQTALSGFSLSGFSLAKQPKPQQTWAAKEGLSGQCRWNMTIYAIVAGGIVVNLVVGAPVAMCSRWRAAPAWSSGNPIAGVTVALEFKRSEHVVRARHWAPIPSRSNSSRRRAKRPASRQGR
jgi:hypothetical protein